MMEQMKKYNKAGETAQLQEEKDAASPQQTTTKDDRDSEVEFVDEDVGYQVHGTTSTTHNEQFYKPVLCLKNLLKFLCVSILGLVLVGLFFSQGTVDNKNQEIKDESIPKEQDKVQINSDQKNKSSQIQKSIEDIQKVPQNQSNINPNDKNIKNITAQPLDFSIEIKQFPRFQIQGEDIQKYGIHKDIQIGSIYDYLNITRSPQFQLFKEKWNSSIGSIIYEFQQNPMMNSKPGILNYTHFKNQNQIQEYLNSLNQWNHKQNYGSDLALYLGSHLLWNANDTKLKETELYYFQKKYKISNYPEELPICLFSTGYKIASRERHISFLNSIDQQNYSNYHVVAVDDNSPDDSAKKIYEYLKGTEMGIKNKIKIVKNMKNLGATLSTYYWSRQLCNPKDIIVHVDMDDMLIGRQVFKVLNAIYHDPNIWYAYTRYIIQWSPAQMPNAGKSRAINFKIKDYRHLLDWKTSAMRTLRYEVMRNVPVQHVVQYHYDEKSGKLQPKFYDTDADRFLVYSQLQLCGDGRIRYISDPFYYYNTSYNLAGKCNMRHEHFDEYKSRVKTGVKPMRSLSDQNVQFYDQSTYVIPKNVTDNLKNRYNKYLDCLNTP